MNNPTLLRNPFLKPAAILTIIFLLLNLPLLAWGHPVPGRWEKASLTKPGDTITVYTKDGGKRRYTFVLINDDVLHCANNYSNDIKIELGTIDRVIVFKAGKYGKYGALWGAAGGAGVLAGMGLSYGDLTTIGVVMTACVGAALGAGVGYLAGAAVGSPGETVYVSKEYAARQAD